MPGSNAAEVTIVHACWTELLHLPAALLQVMYMRLPRTAPYRRRLIEIELRLPPQQPSTGVARSRLSVIVVSWGVVAMSFATMRTPVHFYALRLLLGVAQAGSFPGMWSVPCCQARPCLWMYPSRLGW